MDVMLDCETLGKEPGCAIYQIAAVAFSPEGHEIYIPSIFAYGIYPSSCFKVGLTIDPKTLAWHFDKHLENIIKVFEENIQPCDSLQYVMYELTQFILRIDPERLWVRSISFDIPIIDAAMAVCENLPTAWWKRDTNFRQLHEVRTLLDFCQRKPCNTGKHNALADCQSQIKDVQACFTQRSMSNLLENGKTS